MCKYLIQTGVWARRRRPIQLAFKWGNNEVAPASTIEQWLVIHLQRKNERYLLKVIINKAQLGFLRACQVNIGSRHSRGNFFHLKNFSIPLIDCANVKETRKVVKSSKEQSLVHRRMQRFDRKEHPRTQPKHTAIFQKEWDCTQEQHIPRWSDLTPASSCAGPCNSAGSGKPQPVEAHG